MPGVAVQQTAVQTAGTLFKVIAGGSNPDPYYIAEAIYRAMPNPCVLTGSVMAVQSVTNAANGVVTTLLNHGYATGQVVTFSGAIGMPNLNLFNGPVTVTGEKTFQLGVNTTAWGTYSAGAIAAPNLRNNLITISDYPDAYEIPFVTPPSQQMTVIMEWYGAGNITAEAVINQNAQTAIVNFVNNVPAGAALNLLTLQEQVAIEPVLNLNQITAITWQVSINGVSTPPSGGLQIVEGDPESYFVTTPAQVTVYRAG